MKNFTKFVRRRGLSASASPPPGLRSASARPSLAPTTTTPSGGTRCSAPGRAKAAHGTPGGRCEPYRPTTGNRAEQGAPTIITRNGAPVAALVPIADFNALEEAADELLAREAEAVLAEGGPTVTMAELLADLFSERGDGAA